MANRNFTREMTRPPALQGTALELVAQFLLPKDLGKARAVCQIWNEDLRASNSFVWKQAALNVQPRVVQAVIEDAESREGGVDSVDFYRLAVGLSLNQEETRASGPQLSGQKRKAEDPFRIEDLLVVIEIKRIEFPLDIGRIGRQTISYKSLGALCCGDCSDLLHASIRVPIPATHDLDFTMQGPNFLCRRSSMSLFQTEFYMDNWKRIHERLTTNDYPTNWRQHFLSALAAATRNLRDSNGRVLSFAASTFLIRRDTWRSFCLTKHLSFSHEQYYHSCRTPGAPSEGRFFRGLQDLNHGLFAHVGLDVTPIPAPGSNEEPACLRKIRTTTDPALLNWTAQDEEELRSIQTFEFRISFVTFALKRINDSSNQNEQLLSVLKRLDWK